MSVYQKLQQARIKLQGTELKKSGNNKFAGYQYFELGDFLPAVQGIFSDLGLCGVVSFTADLATLRIVDIETKDEISFTSPMGSAALKGCHEVQNIGAVETYQRRYLWVTAMEIVEHDALDAVTGDGQTGSAKEATRQAPRSVPQVAQTGLKDSEIEDIKIAMHECGDLDALKAMWAAAYKKANDAQRTVLKPEYEKQRDYLTERKAA